MVKNIYNVSRETMSLFYNGKRLAEAICKQSQAIGSLLNSSQ